MQHDTGSEIRVVHSILRLVGYAVASAQMGGISCLGYTFRELSTNRRRVNVGPAQPCSMMRRG